jgi:hypothetical protein
MNNKQQAMGNRQGSGLIGVKCSLRRSLSKLANDQSYSNKIIAGQKNRNTTYLK